MSIAGTRTTASSVSVTVVPPAEVPVTEPMLVRFAVTVTVAVQVIDAPAARVVSGQVTVKSSPGVPGVPLSSLTAIALSETGPVLVTT